MKLSMVILDEDLDELAAQQLPAWQQQRQQDPAVDRRLAAEDQQRDRDRGTLRELTHDPVVKYDGQGQPVRLSEMGLNRADRRALARELRRGA